MRNYRSILSGLTLSAAILAAAGFGAPEAAAKDRGIWNGLHFGVHGGFTDNDYGIRQTAPASALTTINKSGDGGVGGILYGSSWQFGQWVVGTDSEWSWADASAGANIAANGLAATADVDVSSSTRGRVGYLVQPNLLLFGTAGISWSRLKASGTLIAPGADTTKTAAGFQAGVGLEATFHNRFFARVEYAYTDFEKKSFVEVGGGTFDVDLDSNVVRGALGYRFNWSPWDLLKK